MAVCERLRVRVGLPEEEVVGDAVRERVRERLRDPVADLLQVRASDPEEVAVREPDNDRECVPGEGEPVVQLELRVRVADSVRVDGLSDKLAVGGVQDGERLLEDVDDRDPVREGD